MNTRHHLSTSLAKNKLNALIVTIFLLVAGLACGSNTPPPSQYVGVWTGDDGALITIRADGSADYKSGGTSVTGGGLKIDEAAKTLKITFAGMGPTYTIDKAPSGNQMTLSGVVFKRGSGGIGSDPKTDKPATSSSTTSGQIPSDDKLQSLVKTTLLDFNDAVQSEDFEDFHGTVAKPFADMSSPDDMKEAFKVFVEQKSAFNLKGITNMKATFSPAPAMEKVNEYDALALAGSYPTTPKKLRFTLKYIEEDGSWKLISINIKTTGD